MRKENVKTSHLLHLSTTADSKISDQPWVKFQSAGWVNIQSAPTSSEPKVVKTVADIVREVDELITQQAKGTPEQ